MKILLFKLSDYLTIIEFCLMTSSVVSHFVLSEKGEKSEDQIDERKERNKKKKKKKMREKVNDSA